MAKKRTYVEKRDQAPPPEVQRLAEAKGNFPAGDLLIPSPLEIGKVVARIPAGRVLTMQELREFLAARFKADYTCPLTAGIFLRIVAEAAEEEGSTAKCPYWRVVRPDGRLIDKLPGGERRQAERLAAEGVPCKAVGKTGWKVVDLDAHRHRASQH